MFKPSTQGPSRIKTTIQASRASVSSALSRASESSGPSKSFKTHSCLIQKDGYPLEKVRLARDNKSGLFPSFEGYLIIIFRKHGMEDVFLLVKKIPTQEVIEEIANDNGFGKPTGLQTIDEFTFKINNFIFGLPATTLDESKKCYVIFEGDKVDVTLNLYVSNNNKSVMIDSSLKEVKQTFCLQIGSIKYILQFGKKLTWDQLRAALSFRNIIGDNEISRVVAPEYYEESTNQKLKDSYICTGCSIGFDYGVIELTQILSHGSSSLSFDEVILNQENTTNTFDICPLGCVVSNNSCKDSNKILNRFRSLARRHSTRVNRILSLTELYKTYKKFIRNDAATKIQSCYKRWLARKQQILHEHFILLFKIICLIFIQAMTRKWLSVSNGGNPDESSVSASRSDGNPDESSVSASRSDGNPDESSAPASCSDGKPDESSAPASCSDGNPKKLSQRERLKLIREKAINSGFYNNFYFNR